MSNGNTMSFQEKVDAVKAVKRAAPRYHISGGDLPRGYYYGENPYADMLIENALYVDMFPEDVKDKRNFHGFCRQDYDLSHAE